MSLGVTLGEKLMFPSDYLGAVDLKGHDVTVTIASIEWAELRMAGGSTKRKPIIRFDRKEKKLVLNKTNAASIAAQHGNVAEQWVGKQITLYPTRTRCGGQMVDCIRVREPAQEVTNG